MRHDPAAADAAQDPDPHRGPEPHQVPDPHPGPDPAPDFSTLARIEDAYGLDGTREVIPNPVECAASSWHPPAGPKRLLWVGKVNLAKGIDRLLATFEQLAQSDRNIWLDVVGPEGEPGPDGRVLRMEELTAAMPETARRRVCYHGLATPAQIARLRAGSMLTLITSRSEVFSYACFEAAAAGQAVLAMRWPGADRIIQDGVTGILTDEHPSALAAEVCSLLSNPGRLITLGAEARKEVERTLSPTVIAARTTAFYERVLHGSTLQASR